MKKIPMLLISFTISASIFAQLENTKWKATVTIDGPTNVLFSFKKTTVDLYRISDNSLIESMTYTNNDTSFTLTKVDGQSDCNNSTPGLYRFVKLPGAMLIKTIADNCDDRSTVLDKTEWKVWKDYTTVKVADEILKQYVGTYQLDAAHLINITLNNGMLYIEGQNNNLPVSPLMAVSNTKFFLKVAGVEMDFVKDGNGKVIKIISHEAKDYELKKVK